MAEEKRRLIDVIRDLNVSNIQFIEAFVISSQPLKFQAVTDNALIISDSNLLPLGERFSTVVKDAVIYTEGTQQEIQIEINNDIKKDDLFLLIQFNTGETCKYFVLDKI